jgi:tetratricopeptide (TPR) repeat protein
LNITEYTYLMNKPDAVNEKQTVVLEKIVQEFPYFQSARALYLKGLYNENSFKYNYVLKVTAAHTTDRSILFDFITSDTFTSVDKALFEQKLFELSDITVKESEVLEPRLEVRENTVEQSILSLIKEAEPKEPESVPQTEFSEASETTNTELIEIPEVVFDKVPESNDIIAETEGDKTETEIPAELASEFTPDEPTTVTITEEKLEVGKPLEFSRDEKHSFQEWLQLSKIQPIDREEEKKTELEVPEVNSGKQKKNELIDRFIETNPKIPPVKHYMPLPASIIVEPSSGESSYLMTETLARVYLEQKKYHKAIQAYQILILKYPEKSSFFADRILDIKNLQQNNK